MHSTQADGDVALVTGASSGIGKVTAQLLAMEGFRVFGTSRRQQPDENGTQMLKLDIRSGDSVNACVEEVLARTGRLDVLVNNAGVEHIGIAEETTVEEAQALFDTNFFGAVRMVDAVLPDMRMRRHGYIVNIGSAAAWVGEPGESFYAASKRALAGFTESLRHEVWPLGINVSLVEPGAFKTDVIRSATVNQVSIKDYDSVREASLRTLRDSLQKGGNPEQVARVILRILRTPSPRLRYPVGEEAVWLPYLKVLLPQSLFDVLVRRGFGLKRQKS